MSFRKLSLCQLSYSYLLTDIRTMSQGRTTTKNNTSHLIYLYETTHALSASQSDCCF